MPNIGLLLVQMVVILITAWAAGRAMGAVGQPRVVGEMVAGLLLGPSILGALAPKAWYALFPLPSLGFLSALSQLGLILFIFLIGLELDTRSLRASGRAALMISWVSIAVPFAVGVLVAGPLFGMLAPVGVRPVAFALFLGAAMSVTAFPVLARILQERNLTRTPLGTIAIACAAVDDVSAWMILAVVVTIARSTGTGSSLWLALGWPLMYVVFMLTAGRQMLAKLGARIVQRPHVGHGDLVPILLAILVSAGVTELIGIHALFGAFVAGAMMPRDERLTHALVSRFEGALMLLLLPLYFAFTGLRTRFDTFGNAGHLALFGLILLVAVGGKFGGTSIAARLTGMPWRSAAALGALMNTRGLMELVILNIGLDIGVISPALFAMMVLMAVATTVMTSPLLSLLRIESREASPHRLAA